jgi:cystathionine beta-lyase/cystathionine gamma-synthase
MTGLGNLRPKFLESVDVICYSLTKFIGGHNDLIGGILFVKDEIYEQAWALRSRMGNIIRPMEAFLSMRSLRTFALRMEAHLKSTEVVLGFMQEQTQQRTLRGYFYPGFGQNLDQEFLVEEVLFHRGSVLSFIPNRTRDEVAQSVRDLKFIKLAPSFGSTDSLFEICSLMTRPDATERELLESGLEPNLVRLSIGIDRPDLIIDDLEKILR